MCDRTTDEMWDWIRGTFILAYDCGRNDEREDKARLADMPSNVVDLEHHRDKRLASR